MGYLLLTSSQLSLAAIQLTLWSLLIRALCACPAFEHNLLCNLSNWLLPACPLVPNETISLRDSALSTPLFVIVHNSWMQKQTLRCSWGETQFMPKPTVLRPCSAQCGLQSITWSHTEKKECCLLSCNDFLINPAVGGRGGVEWGGRRKSLSPKITSLWKPAWRLRYSRMDEQGPVTWNQTDVSGNPSADAVGWRRSTWTQERHRVNWATFLI